MKGMANGLKCNEEYSIWTVRIRSLTRCCTCCPRCFSAMHRAPPLGLGCYNIIPIEGLDEFTPKAPELDQKNSLAQSREIAVYGNEQ
ncbi:hypothetical protein POTOM_056303 [Populus tomentosa]|uniref:Uncharacterized protein n=1 Tax=Populus tomentosa TaxID=118781 RepID=A0A8X7XYT7_POPTO|nr:hypothetical protein POTOM_056303 [Populus tomentosa]